jgi:predicted secreted protein
MATHAGSEGVVKTAAKDGTVATVGEVRSYTIESSAEVIEDTTLSDTDRTYKVGLKTFTGTLEVFFDETDAEQSRLDVGTEIEFDVYREGDTSGDTYYAGEAIVTGRSITASIDGMVEMSVSVQGNGALTESTVA